MRTGLYLFIVWLVSACVSDSMIISGPVYPPLERSEVVVYLGQAPGCEFAVVAHLQAQGGYLKRDSLITGFRQQAADVGANALQIIDIQRIGTSEYVGSARALRCID